MDVHVDTFEKKFPAAKGHGCNYLKNKTIQVQAGLEGLSLPENRIPAGTVPVIQKDGFDGGIPESENSVSCPQRQWFVMRDLKRANAKLPAYKLLEGEHIEVFTPMKKIIVAGQGNGKPREVPFIQDLLFVHSTPEELDPILEKNPTLQYRYVRGGKYKEPMTVPDTDMERFLQVVRTSDFLRYYRPEELVASMYGRRIRIMGGILDSYEGCLLKRCRKKVLLVELQGFLSAGVEVSPEYIQFI